MNIKSLCLAGIICISVGTSAEPKDGALHAENHNNVTNANWMNVSPNDDIVPNIANQTVQNTQQQNINVADHVPALITVPAINEQPNNNVQAHNQPANIMPFPAQIVNGDLHIPQDLGQILGLGTGGFGYFDIVVPDIANLNANEQNGDVTNHAPALITVPAINEQLNNNISAHMSQTSATTEFGQNMNNGQQENL